MSSRDLVDIFKEKEDVFDLETIMYVAFMEYKNRKRSREIYNRVVRKLKMWYNLSARYERRKLESSLYGVTLIHI